MFSKAEFPYELRLAQGRLLYLGFKHTKDPSDPQLASLRQRFDEFKPDVVLVEARIRLFYGDLEKAMRTSESHVAFVLARDRGIQVYSLEPDPVAEAAYMRERGFSDDQIHLLRFLSVYLGDGGRGAVSDQEAQRLLDKRARLYRLNSGIKSLADVDSAWRAVSSKPDWRDVTVDDFAPRQDEGPLNRVSWAANEVRDDHFCRSIVSLVSKGKRVLVISGASHTIMNQPVLAASLNQYRHG